MENFDFIVVGAGSAGCILVNKLTDNGSYNVQLIEADPANSHPMIHVPRGFMKIAASLKHIIPTPTENRTYC